MPKTEAAGGRQVGRSPGDHQLGTAQVGVIVDHRHRYFRVAQLLHRPQADALEATGDLARRKLLPGLLRLFQAGLMPEFRIVGVSMEEIGDAEFRDRSWARRQSSG